MKDPRSWILPDRQMYIQKAEKSLNLAEILSAYSALLTAQLCSTFPVCSAVSLVLFRIPGLACELIPAAAHTSYNNTHGYCDDTPG